MSVIKSRCVQSDGECKYDRVHDGQLLYLSAAMFVGHTVLWVLSSAAMFVSHSVLRDLGSNTTSSIDVIHILMTVN